MKTATCSRGVNSGPYDRISILRLLSMVWTSCFAGEEGLWIRVTLRGSLRDGRHWRRSMSDRQGELVRKLDAFHAANRVSDPDQIVHPEEAAKLLEVVEAFVGLGLLNPPRHNTNKGTCL